MSKIKNKLLLIFNNIINFINIFKNDYKNSIKNDPFDLSFIFLNIGIALTITSTLIIIKNLLF